MDSGRYREMKSDRGVDAADESGQAGYFAFGGIVLVLGGLVLLLQSHASVADFAGAMLAVMGIALLVASMLAAGRRSDG